MINVIRDEPVVVAITLDELLLAGEIPIELRYILFSAKVILVMFSLHEAGVIGYLMLVYVNENESVGEFYV